MAESGLRAAAPQLRVLLFSTLYPSETRPGHGIFVETRLRELLRSGAVQARVLAPVPWFPFTHERFGDKARMARTPRHEQREGVSVAHPRYPVIPKVGMTLAPLLLALASWWHLRRSARTEGAPDVVDAHYFYPDGVAAALLAAWLRRPLVITARGSDVNLIAEHALPRAMMRWAARRAAACVGVSQALARRLVEIGAPADRVHVLRNGVDTTRFHPIAGARRELGVPEGVPQLVSVGNLLPVKRHHLVIEALALLRQDHPGARLAVIGGGPLAAELRARAAALGVADAVQFTGPVPQDRLALWYSAADVLVLASSREGWPNVLLEAMACGTPVVASDVGGVGEIVSRPELGLAVPVEAGADIAAAVGRLLAAPPDREAVRGHALTMGWAAVSAEQQALLRRAAGAGA